MAIIGSQLATYYRARGLESRPSRAARLADWAPHIRNGFSR